MLQNESVRYRLRNQLNVQLTQSNVVQTQNQVILGSRIIKNQAQSSQDLSIIDELGLLEHFDKNKEQPDSFFVDEKRSILVKEQYEKTTKFTPYNQERASPLGLKSKIRAYREELEVHNQYRNLHKFNQIKLKHTQAKTPPRTYINQDNTKSIPKQIQDIKEIADIEEKISILPIQLQQKIRQNLHKKIKTLSNDKQTPNQANSMKPSDLFIHDFYKVHESVHQPVQQQNQNVVFHIPMQDKQSLDQQMIGKQKFVSVNRDQLTKNKSANKSIIFKESLQLKSKHSTPHLNLNLNSQRRRQIERSRQKYGLNSIQLKKQQYYCEKQVRRFQEYSKGKYRQNSKGKNTFELMQKRKNDFKSFNEPKLTVQPSQLRQKSPSCEQHTQQNFTIRQNLHQISQQFNHSKIIRHYSEILSSLPKCKKCHTSFGAVTLDKQEVQFTCNQCDLKNNCERSISFLSSNVNSGSGQSNSKWNTNEKTVINFNHPIIGVLFDIENKLMNETQMKIYNTLLKDITSEIDKIEQIRKKLIKLYQQIQCLKSKLRNNSKSIFQSKSNLKKILNNLQFSVSSADKFKQQQKLKSVEAILPSQYLQQLDIWCKIKSQDFTQWPQIDQKLQVLCPLYMKKHIKTIRQFLDPLLHNFQNNDVRISISQGLKLPVKSLSSATFIVDGSYNISTFQQIQKLRLQFSNKRTFRQITSLMQNLPPQISQLHISYNHKLNSHISAQKYPLLTKLSSIRSCTKLFAQIQNCKDEDDLVSALKVMTRKRQLKLHTTRSIYVRRPVVDLTTDIKQMIRRIGKHFCFVQLFLAIDYAEEQLYRQLLIVQVPYLMKFNIQSTIINQAQPKITHLPGQLKKQQDNLLSAFSVSNVNQNENNCQHNTQQNLQTSKQHFANKIRRKLSALMLFKQSYQEKERIQKYCHLKQKASEMSRLMKKHKDNHDMRLDVFKMLI